jgi:hypothetical protein
MDRQAGCVDSEPLAGGRHVVCSIQTNPRCTPECTDPPKVNLSSLQPPAKKPRPMSVLHQPPACATASTAPGATTRPHRPAAAATPQQQQRECVCVTSA